MLESFNAVKVNLFPTLTDEALLIEKEIALKQYEFIQRCSTLKPVLASTMMGKMEWYIGKILGEMYDRGLDEGFKLPKEQKKLKFKYKKRKFKEFFLPRI